MKQFKDNVLVQTKQGTLCGYQFDDIYRFFGVRYATAQRFMPPEPVAPWEGVVDAKGYGYTCPLMTQDSPRGDFSVPHRWWPQDEDCLNLNIWTKDINPKAKKPVMVWIHGGILTNGSALEMVAYDGTNMSKYGDVVTITINHRLNILGYFDLSSYGEQFKNSVNAGLEDLVAALQWIHDNIESFGGDPENVTLFGQSGGGIKIATLLQCPAADHLYHKVMLISGGAGGPSKDGPETAAKPSREIADAMIARLGGSGVETLQTCSYRELADAFLAVAPGFGYGFAGMFWFPGKNDWYLGTPWESGFTPYAQTVPMMVGSVMGEFLARFDYPNKNSVAPADRRAIIAERFGEDAADELIAAFKKVFPDKNELTLCGMANRNSLLQYAKKRAADCSADTYCYLFTYDFPIENSISWHCADIPFFFHNTELVPVCNGEGCDEAEAQVFGAAMAFAHTGSPNGVGLAKWPAFTMDTQQTMFLDAVSHAGNDQHLQDLHEAVAIDMNAMMTKKK